MLAAFRDLHATRLHGFTLLVALGDRRRAARAAGDALAAGARRAGELRHPERAAAWLRAVALRRLRRGTRRGTLDPERRQALAQLGAEGAAIEGLASLNLDDRAAIVAAVIERLQPSDVATVLRRDLRVAARQVAVARQRYLDAAAAIDGLADPRRPTGPLAARIAGVVSQTMGPTPTAGSGGTRSTGGPGA